MSPIKEYYSTIELPNYVMYWFGGWPVRLIKMTKTTWLFVGTRQSLIVSATHAKPARRAARDFVAHVSERTDKRRRHWVYT